MAIELHCNFCGKLVRAPDDAAGKQGKCPACHQVVYIPTPSDQIEPLDLAPIDEAADREARRLEAEAVRFAARVASERAPAAADKDRPRPAAGRPEPGRGREAEEPAPSGKINLNLTIAAMVEEYAVAMAAGDLSAAEVYADELKRNLNRADQAIERILNGHETPERLRGVPPPVLGAFFKQLRGA